MSGYVKLPPVLKRERAGTVHFRVNHNFLQKHYLFYIWVGTLIIHIINTPHQNVLNITSIL